MSFEATQEPGGELRCAECQTLLREGDERVDTEEASFCRHCFDQLQAQIHDLVAQQSENVNYPAALAGGLIAALLGAVAWWGFTSLTNIQFGLVAWLIGILVGRAVVMVTGKRARGLQIMAVALTVFGYFAGQWLLLRDAIASEVGGAVPIIPDEQMLELLMQVSTGGFDLLFMAFAIWEAWRAPAPLKLG